ncbi:hypothetical protein [Cupriavidus basilensis]|uniref:hypothetical protein n=1 Tax=Cupriavidus basilensis TaxID=68895 RepID=UPI0020A65AFF|nr:hypothetical protein [Cupriavidus basilensis]MCP3018011.1 hypothetical protein [Cupriavidus basilensis]
MMQQGDLFLIQPVPRLDVARFEAWPFPGLTARETAQCALSMSAEYKAAIASAIASVNHPMTTESMVLAAIPQDWKDVLGPWFHANLSAREGEQHSIEVKYVTHDGAGFHWEYRVMEGRRHA